MHDQLTLPLGEPDRGDPVPPTPSITAPVTASITAVALGPQAFAALGRAIVDAQVDPLDPVTVIVPSNFVGLAARRRLIADGVSLVNVSFATPYQIANDIASADQSRAGMLPLTNAVLAAAVRRALRDTESIFGAVRDHRATEFTFVRTYRELSRVRPETLDRLEAQGQTRTRDAVGLYRRIEANLDGYVNEDHLAAAAADLADEPRYRHRLGAVICFLVEDLTPALADLICALVSSEPSSIIVGLSGDTQADASAHLWLGRLGWKPPSQTTGDAPVATDIIEAADPDDEITAVVRDIASRVDGGERLDRMAVYYPTADPYATALREQLSQADIAFNAPSGRTVSGSFVGRALLRLMDIAFASDRSRLRRSSVIDLATSGPLRNFNGEPLRPRQWDDISKLAGVLEGFDDWMTKLDRFDATLVDDYERAEREGESPGRLRAIERRRSELSRLRDFVTQLAIKANPDTVPSSWSARAEWFGSLLDELLVPENRRHRWPETELDAADRVADVLVSVSVLDAIEPNPTPQAFARAVTTLLDRPTGRIGKFGQGVTLAPLRHGLGMDADTVYIVGMIEGTCPGKRREDSVLPDADRRLAVDNELAIGVDRLQSDHRYYLGALASGSTRILTTCRADQRNGRSRLPSRWLLDSASTIAGHTVYSSEWPDLASERIRRHVSFAGALVANDSPASLAEFDLTRLARVAMIDGAQAALADPIVAEQPELHRGLEMLRSRRRDTFGPFDGHVGPGIVRLPAITSASRLEAWATCPMKYFLSYELGLGSIDDPERLLRMSSRDRGEMWHLILERFIGEQTAIPASERIRPERAWDSGHRQRLHAIADEVFDEFEAKGMTGKALVWGETKREIRADLDTFLIRDSQYRARHGLVPEATELRIGPPQTTDDGDNTDLAAHLSVVTDGQRTVALRGFVDRVDLDLEGKPNLVDYKSGQDKVSQKNLDEDPVVGGGNLQLALYGMAAAEHYGAAPATASYWYTSERGKFARPAITIDAEAQDRCRHVVKTITTGIGAGVFPMNSGPYDQYYSTFKNCAYCDFDAVCPTDRDQKTPVRDNDDASGVFVSLRERPSRDAGSPS